LLPAGANRRVGLAPTGKRRLVTAHPHSCHLAFENGRNRRNLPVAAGCGEGPVTEPTAATQHGRRERLFMPSPVVRARHRDRSKKVDTGTSGSRNADREIGLLRRSGNGSIEPYSLPGPFSQECSSACGRRGDGRVVGAGFSRASYARPGSWHRSGTVRCRPPPPRTAQICGPGSVQEEHPSLSSRTSPYRLRAR